ncbi:hypothetical protein P9314_09140 [Paenibacillus validus]|nr:MULTISPECIES: hypothetical protein [Paenibacillus]MED4600867.1 hypothetical protein [Paenibacillus validus]MED4606639.1 hypothetical protein [Paenibacillus validus]
MMQKLRHMGTEMKYAMVSTLSVLLVLALHLVHWLSAPLLMGAMEMHEHHHGLNHDASGYMEMFTVVLLIANGAGMYFALRQLALALKQRKRGWHHDACTVISLGVLVMGVYTITTVSWPL